MCRWSDAFLACRCHPSITPSAKSRGHPRTRLSFFSRRVDKDKDSHGSRESNRIDKIGIIEGRGYCSRATGFEIDTALTSLLWPFALSLGYTFPTTAKIRSSIAHNSGQGENHKRDHAPDDDRPPFIPIGRGED